MNTMDGISRVDRRKLLVGGVTLLGGCATAASGRSSAARAQSAVAAGRGEPGSDEPIVVLVELFGGNDGLNTVVPLTDDAYYRRRAKTCIQPGDALRIDEHRGFHPALANLRRRYDGGHMAIVQGVGYPQPVYSHFKSFEIWHTARPEGRVSGDGWIGRVRGGAWKDDPRAELVVHVGDNVPYSLRSSTHQFVAFATPESYVWAGDELATRAYEDAARIEGDTSARAGRAKVLARLQQTLGDAQSTSPRVLKATLEYRTEVEYPATALGSSMRAIAGMIDADLGTRVYSVAHGNFDTHATQLAPHAQLLETLDGALDSFLEDISRGKNRERVLVLAYSEFGRRVSENYSAGTDHGAAGLAFFLGERVKGGFYGKQPSLSELDQDENLIFNVDFRSLYATVLDGWLKTDSSLVLPARYPVLPVLA